MHPTPEPITAVRSNDRPSTLVARAGLAIVGVIFIACSAVLIAG